MGKIDIKIGTDFRVTNDDLNYILEYRTVVKKGKNAGKEKWELAGYYHNMALLAEDVLDMLPMTSSKLRDDLSSVIHAVDDAKTQILKALK